VLSEIAARVAKVQDDENQARAFIENNSPKTVDIIFVTADKGLCGGFNMITIKAVRELLASYKEQGVNVRLRVSGRKGMDYFNFQGVELLQKEVGLSAAPTYEKATSFIKSAYEDFGNEITDKVILIHNGFYNMLTQELQTQDLLPISLGAVSIDETGSMLDIEPDDDEEVLNELTAKYIDFNMYYALIDSLAAEHSARMQAMDNATNNAKERVDDLTVEFNKARQAAITTELIEIISGVEAQK
jgi:F-type H+-transporting ATPase subunit gamma